MLSQLLTSNIIDTDNSGNITIEELKAAFEPEGHEKDGEMWSEIMKEVDKDGDNSISYEEFYEAMTQVLKKQHIGNDNRA